MDVKTLLVSSLEEDRKKGIALLTRIPKREVFPLLETMAEADESLEVRFYARKALNLLKSALKPLVLENPEQIQPIGTAVKFEEISEDEKVRVVQEIINKNLKQNLPFLLSLLKKETAPKVLAAVLVAVGKFGSEQEIPLLVPFLEHSVSRVRANAIEAMEYLGSLRVYPHIFPLLQDEDNRVKANALRAIKAVDPASSIRIVQEMLNSPNVAFQASAAYILRFFVADRHIDSLVPLLKSPAPSVSRNALATLGIFRDKGLARAGEVLTQASRSTPVDPPADTSDEFSGQIADLPPAPDSLAAALAREDPRERVEAIELAASFGGEGTGAILAGHLAKEQDPRVIGKIYILLGKLRHAPALPLLLNGLSHTDQRCRANAVEAIGNLGEAAALAHLRPLLADPNNRVRGNAIIALRDDPQAGIIDSLNAMVASSEVLMGKTAIYVIQELQRPDMLPALFALETSSLPEVSKGARYVIKTFREKGLIAEPQTESAAAPETEAGKASEPAAAAWPTIHLSPGSDHSLLTKTSSPRPAPASHPPVSTRSSAWNPTVTSPPQGAPGPARANNTLQLLGGAVLLLMLLAVGAGIYFRDRVFAMIGRVCFEKRDLANAQRFYFWAMQSAPQNPEYAEALNTCQVEGSFEKGRTALSQDYLEQADHHFAEALKVRPGHEPSLRLRKQVALKQLWNQGRQALSGKDRERALKAFEELLALDPSHAEAGQEARKCREFLAQFAEGEEQIRQKNWAKALLPFAALEAAHPDDTRIRARRGEIEIRGLAETMSPVIPLLKDGLKLVSGALQVDFSGDPAKRAAWKACRTSLEASCPRLDERLFKADHPPLSLARSALMEASTLILGTLQRLEKSAPGPDEIRTARLKFAEAQKKTRDFLKHWRGGCAAFSFEIGTPADRQGLAELNRLARASFNSADDRNGGRPAGGNNAVDLPPLPQGLGPEIVLLSGLPPLEMFQKAVSSFTAGRREEAFTWYLQAVLGDPDIQSQNDQGLVLKAVSFFQEKQEKGPLPEADAYFQVAFLFLSGSQGEAKKAFAAFVQAFPRSPFIFAPNWVNEALDAGDMAVPPDEGPTGLDQADGGLQKRRNLEAINAQRSDILKRIESLNAEMENLNYLANKAVENPDAFHREIGESSSHDANELDASRSGLLEEIRQLREELGLLDQEAALNH